MEIDVYSDLREGLRTNAAFDPEERDSADRTVIRELLFDMFVIGVLYDEDEVVPVEFSEDVDPALVDPKSFEIKEFEVKEGNHGGQYHIDLTAISPQNTVDSENGVVYNFRGTVSQLSDDDIFTRTAEVREWTRNHGQKQ